MCIITGISVKSKKGNYTNTKTIDTLKEYISYVIFSQIIQIRPYQFQPLLDNIERYQSFGSV